MSSKPNFEQIAIQIVDSNELTGNNALVADIAKYLNQSWGAGYRYAVVNDWWQTQEASISDGRCIPTKDKGKK